MYMCVMCNALQTKENKPVLSRFKSEHGEKEEL